MGSQRHVSTASLLLGRQLKLIGRPRLSRRPFRARLSLNAGRARSSRRHVRRLYSPADGSRLLVARSRLQRGESIDEVRHNVCRHDDRRSAAACRYVGVRKRQSVRLVVDRHASKPWRGCLPRKRDDRRVTNGEQGRLVDRRHHRGRQWQRDHRDEHVRQRRQLAVHERVCVHKYVGYRFRNRRRTKRQYL